MRFFNKHISGYAQETEGKERYDEEDMLLEKD